MKQDFNSTVSEALKRIALDPGILYGCTQVCYNAPHNPLYAWLTGGSLAASVGIRAFNLWPKLSLPLLLSGASLGVIAAHSAVTSGWDGVQFWGPAGAFAVANSLRAVENSFKTQWDARGRTFGKLMSGENFAAGGVGLMAMFIAGPENILTTTISVAAVLVALGATIGKGRGDIARGVLGANSTIAMTAAALGDDWVRAAAGAFSALGSFRLAYIIREMSGRSVPFAKPKPA